MSSRPVARLTGPVRRSTLAIRNTHNTGEFAVATDLELELEAFHQFLDRNGREYGTLEHAVEQFRAYQRELADARAGIREAKESSASGESKELNIEETIYSVRTRLGSVGKLVDCAVFADVMGKRF